jgi:hypothetical protein
MTQVSIGHAAPTSPFEMTGSQACIGRLTPTDSHEKFIIETNNSYRGIMDNEGRGIYVE